jgi:hypothetical protein
MKMKNLIYLLPFFCFSIVIWGQSGKPGKSALNAVKTDKPIEMTGKLDDPVWQSASPVEIAYEIQPGENIPAPQKTFVRALYDDKNLYFGFQCFDTNPEQIRANISDRDKIFQDDFVGIILDTYGDFQRAYELMVNPFGIKADLMRTGSNEDDSFDMIWNTAAARNEKGWTVVMAIPFSSINFPDKEEQVWTLMLMRILPRASRTQISWTTIDRNNPGLLSQAGILAGLKNIKSGGNIELLPYIMGQKSGYMNNYDNPNSGIKYDPIIGRFGGSIKYSPSTSFSVEAVVNPDFSQIESDADQISVNTTFALQYDEKRPFFLTGRESLPSPLYYSRSINDPLYAGRIMGKSGGFTYMYLGAYDRNTVFVIPGEEMSSTIATSLKSYVNIGRLRYDFGDETYIAGLVTARNLEGGSNYLAGVDYKYKFLGNWYFSGMLYLSQTKELNDVTLFNSQRKFTGTGHTASFDGENYSGTGVDMSLSHNSRSYSLTVEYNDVSPTFQAYNGIATNNAYRQIMMEHDYTFYPQSSFLDQSTVSINSYMKFNYEGVKKEQVIQPGLSFTFKGQTYISFSYLLVNDEKLFGEQLNGVQRVSIYVQSRPMNEVSLTFSGQFGNFIYRTSDPTVGEGHNISATLQLKPASKIDISFSFTRSRLSDKETDNTFFDGNIYRMVGIYQFNPEMMFRTILQYNTFDKAFQLYPLFSYKMNAFTTFFLGATSNYYNYEGEYGFKNIEQQYFVKMQYLLGI